MKNHYKLLCLFSISFLLNISVQSQHSLIFTENKGQWHENVKFKADFGNGSVFLESNRLTFDFFHPDDAPHHHEPLIKSPEHHKNPKLHHQKVRRHAYRLNFKGANYNAEIIPGDEVKGYANYFYGRNQSKWATDVKSYGTIEYKDLYHNIDLKLFGKEGNFVYDLIVYPGANIEDITLLYEGIDGKKIKDGNLIIKTSVGEITELYPFAYQILDNDTIEIPCKYSIKEENVSFSMPAGYDRNEPLIIDPTLIFATYSGSTSDNWGFTATYDNDGNVYSGGIVNGNGYPVNTGAYQTTWGGSWDAAIIKYTPDGTERLFATYLGGSSSDMPHSLIVNEFNELLILGTTGSADFPVSTNAYDTTFNGGSYVNYLAIVFDNGTDIYVSKLSPDGDELMGSTYIGGSQNDGLNFREGYDHYNGNGILYYNYGDGARGEINTDDQNNVYIGTCTFSDDFPVTASAFQKTLSGKQEGVTFKLDYSLSTLVWSSYIGGSEDDAVYSVDVDSQYELYIAGGTNSTDFPTTDSVIFTTAPGGVADAFVGHISYNGDTLRSASYFGSDKYDQAYFVRTDKYDNVFIYGQTKATGTTLIQNADYNKPNSGQFITKFDNALDSIVWSTTFGTGNGRPNISPTAFAVDICNRIYISGSGREWTEWRGFVYDPDLGYQVYDFGWDYIDGTKNMDITPDAYQDTTDGQDFYVMVMDDDASELLYATFFGEIFYGGCTLIDGEVNCTGCYMSGRDHVDGGTSRFDKNGNIYQSMCASCGGCQGIPVYPTPGVWSPTNNSTNCNNAVFRISLLNDFAKADFRLPQIGCAPYTIDFQNFSQGTEFLWDFGDGATSTDSLPSHTYTESGFYDITLIAKDPHSCNLADTIVKKLWILSNTVDTLPGVEICYGENVQIGLPPNPAISVTYDWIPVSGLSDTTILNPYASPDSTIQYALLISNGICTDTLYQTVTVRSTLIDTEISSDAILTGDSAHICPGDSIEFEISSQDSVIRYIWSYSSSFKDTINKNGEKSIKIQPTQDTIVYAKSKGFYCDAIGIDSIMILLEKPELGLSQDTMICSGDTIFLEAKSIISYHELDYRWSPEKLIIDGKNTEKIIVAPKESQWFYTNATNQYNCAANDSVFVEIDDVSVNLIDKQNITCSGYCDGSITVSGNGIDPIQYSWSNGETSPTISNLCNGDYQIIVYDSLSCQASLSITIEPAIEITIEQQDVSDILCHNQSNGKIEVSALGGSPPLQYSIDGTNFQNSGEFTGLSGGTYSVTIRDKNNCTYTISDISVENPPPLVISQLTKTDIICHDENNGTITVQGSGGVGNYSYAINSQAPVSTSTFSGLSEGNYTIKLFDENNCQTQATAEIINPPRIEIQKIEQHEITCHNFDNGYFELLATGGTGKITFICENTGATNTSGVFNNLTHGVYTFTIKDENNCSRSIHPIYFINPEPVIIQGVAVDRLDCFGDNDATAEINAEGGYGQFQYAINEQNPQSDNVFIDLGAGIYTFHVWDKNNCHSSQSVEIIQPPELQINNFSKQDITCHNDNDGQVSIFASGGTGSYRYIMNDKKLKFSNSFFYLSGGIYTFSVLDENNCRTSDTLRVINPPPLSIDDIYKNPVSCYNESNGEISVIASGGTGQLFYSMNDAPVVDDPHFTNLPAGSYQFDIYDENNCTTGTETILLQNPPQIIISDISTVDVLCFNDTNGEATLSATGGTGTLLYSVDGINYQKSPVFNKLSPGIYTFSIKDSRNCTTNSEQIEINSPPQILVSDIEIDSLHCHDDSDAAITIYAGGGSGDLQFSINNALFTDQNTFTNLQAGIYTFYIKDENACLIADTIEITNPEELKIIQTNVTGVLCHNDSNGSISIMVRGGTGNYQYRVNQTNPMNDSIFTDLSVGEYQITITDSKNCSIKSDTLKINNPPQLKIADIVVTEPKCFGDNNGYINIDAIGGTPPLSYSIRQNEFTKSPEFGDLYAGEYLINVKDTNDCKTSKAVSISEPEMLVIDYQSVIDVKPCFGDSTGVIALHANGGTSPYFYTLDTLHQSGNARFEKLPANQYEVVIEDSHQCDTTIKVLVEQPDSIFPQIETTNVCHNVCDGTASIQINGGLAPYNVRFDGNLTDDYEEISGLCAGDYTLKIRDKLQCEKDRIVTIYQSPEMQLSVTKTKEILCFGDKASAQITVEGGTTPFSYFWNEENNPSKSDNDNLTEGVHKVTIIDGFGCMDSVSFFVDEPDRLDFDYQKQNATCDGVCDGALELAVSGGTEPYQYEWNNGQTLHSLSGICAGQYSVIIRDAHLCERNDTFVIKNNYPLPEIQITADRNSIIRGESTRLSAINGYSIYDWSPSGTMSAPYQPETDISPLVTTTYTLEVTDERGCMNTDTITIFVDDAICDEPYIFVPNAFTPDNPANNNHILYVRSNVITEMYFAVYNRWGEVVFETTDINTGWDGTYKGKKLEPAVFVYFLSASCYGGDTYTKKGNVTLIR